MSQRENRRLVYSSETGSVRYCPRCGLPAHAGRCADEAALAELAKTLKQLTGTGGTVRGTAIELQGNQRERVAAYLTGAGYRVKLAGG
jgi:translation initiation factor 1